MSSIFVLSFTGLALVVPYHLTLKGVTDVTTPQVDLFAALA